VLGDGYTVIFIQRCYAERRIGYGMLCSFVRLSVPQSCLQVTFTVGY